MSHKNKDLRGMLRQSKRAAERYMATREAAKQGLEIRFFDRWEPGLNEALSSLPERAICPHELFRMLTQNPGPAHKLIILVAEKGTPIALVCLRYRSGSWEPVTQWLVPGYVFPVQDGKIWRILGAIGLDLHVAWWRWDFPPEPFPWINDVKSAPTYGLSCSDDFEIFWRQSHHFKNIRKVRNRCKEFEFRINDPGMREWTIQNWGEKWGGGSMSDLSDRHMVAEFLEKKELLYTLSLHDQGKPIAGSTMLVHNNDAVAYVNHRDPEYDYYGVMTRLIESCFSWAKERSFRRIDIGGSADYKKNWAPEMGIKYQFIVSPHLSFKNWHSSYVRRFLNRLDSFLSS